MVFMFDSQYSHDLRIAVYLSNPTILNNTHLTQDEINIEHRNGPRAHQAEAIADIILSLSLV